MKMHCLGIFLLFVLRGTWNDALPPSIGRGSECTRNATVRLRQQLYYCAGGLFLLPDFSAGKFGSARAHARPFKFRHGHDKHLLRSGDFLCCIVSMLHPAMLAI